MNYPILIYGILGTMLGIFAIGLCLKEIFRKHDDSEGDGDY